METPVTRVTSVECWTCQRLPKEVAEATRRKVRQLAEPLIADGLVEPRGLKAEGVQPCCTASSQASLSLNGAHEVASNTVASHRIIYPQMTDIQPSPVGVSVDTTEDLVNTANKDSEWPAIL